MLRRIKGAILAAGAAFFVAVSGAVPALAGGWSSVPGQAYDLGFKPFLYNILWTIHDYGFLAGALGITWGFLVMHSPSPQHKQHAYGIIIGAVVAMLGLYFSPQIWGWLWGLNA